MYLAVRHRGHRALLYIPRALEETARQWVQNGRRLAQQLQDLNDQQLDHLLQRKQQLAQQRRRAKTRRPEHAP